MTTQLTTYRAALEHIRDGSDAVCTDCGWMGAEPEADGEEGEFCPKCHLEAVTLGADEIAAYVLAQAEKVQP